MANLTNVNINGALIRKEGTLSFSPASNMFPQGDGSWGGGFTSSDTDSQAVTAVDPNNAGRFIVAFRDSTDGNKGKCRIGTMQANHSVVYGTESIFNNDITHDISIAWEDNNVGGAGTSCIVIVFNEENNSFKSSAIIGTVSSTAITGYGTKKEIANASPNHQNSYNYVAFDPNTAGKFVISEDQHLSVCTHNGSTITQGTIVLRGTVATTYTEGPVIWDPNDASKFITVYKDHNASQALKARVGQVSGTTITLQAEATITTDSTDFIGLDADPNNANKYIVSYDNNTASQVSAQVLTVAGSTGSWTISGGTASAVTTGDDEYTNVFFTNMANKFIVTWSDVDADTGSGSTWDRRHAVARVGTISGTNISFLEPTVVVNNRDSRMSEAKHTSFDKLANKFVVVYNHQETSATGKVGILSTGNIKMDVSTGNFFEVDMSTPTGSISSFTITEALTGAQAQTFFLKVTQGSPAKQFAWSSLTNIKWPGGTGPTLSTAYTAVDVFRFTTYDQGTTWWGETIGLNYPNWRAFGDRGVFAGGYGSATVNTIEYINITTTSNVTDFGDLAATQSGGAAVTNGSRGIFGGKEGTPGVFEYITIATPGNASTFGTAIERRYDVGSASGRGRGLIAGGLDNTQSGSYRTLIEYITIATTGNGTTFGNLSWTGTDSGQSGAPGAIAGVSDDIRAIFGGGHHAGPNYFDQMEYVTIQTPGDSAVFGTLTVARHTPAGVSNGFRGVYGGGQTAHSPSALYSNTLDYITIATTGNGTDFGDLAIGGGRKSLAGAHNSTRGVFAGGYKGSQENTIEYITIATTGNSVDFGNLSEVKHGTVATSGN